MTDIPEQTNIIPITRIYRRLPLNAEIAETNPPSPSEPVSPMNTEALFVLKRRYPASTPHKTRLKYTSGIPSRPESRKMSAASAAKYQKLTDAASPSNPSVRLTQLVAATKANAASGIIQTPMSKESFVNGMCRTVRSLR